ncbi:MAG: histone deacetylase family protein [Victivallales bacterium]|nr:histone deacetylase family protein [Victivallales bacterium]
MFRIRRIYDTGNPSNEEALSQVKRIFREQFPSIDPEEIDTLPEKLKNPLKYQFRSILFIADNGKTTVGGFALLTHAPDLDFCFLDYLSAARRSTGRGIGGALYERVREEAAAIGVKALFFECLPDDPRISGDPKLLKQNKARLRFYEKYGARPVVNTAYETPVKEGQDNPPYIMIDFLGKERRISRSRMRKIVRAILERKYPGICNRRYIEEIVKSVRDPWVRLRPLKYVSKEAAVEPAKTLPADKMIVLTHNEGHVIHHVADRGYVESPVRVKTMLAALERSPFFKSVRSRHFPDKLLCEVHDKEYISYIKRVCSSLGEKQSVYPSVFPLRKNARPPKELPLRAGYYCIDTFTPLNKNAYLAAREAVDCALTAAEAVRDGAYLAYALVRPPGHHAEKRACGGFCYLNSTAIAAHFLSRSGKVAILDLDYHHGNGQQNIFYERDDVLTVSIHGDPISSYPFFSGFRHERGKRKGLGFNINYPLPENISTEKYGRTLKTALRKILDFRPRYLVVALGLDTARGDPTGAWPLVAKDFSHIGRMVGAIPFSTLFVQEGGYKTRTIGRNLRSFFEGVWQGSFL